MAHRIPLNPALQAKIKNAKLAHITADSRKVRRRGSLFAVMPPASADEGEADINLKYLHDAKANSAVAILVGKNCPNDILSTDILSNDILPVIESDNVRADYAKLALQFICGEEMALPYMVAVTGTNGKSSILWFYRHLLNLAGKKIGTFGTHGIYQGDKFIRPLALTTPDALEFAEILKDFHGQKISHLAFEASSHGLYQQRLGAVRVDIAIFTNLSHDHLDFHKNFDHYRDAKFRLAADHLSDGGVILSL